MLTATAMGFFEKEIAKAVVLALFVPLIISSGGNSGSQASTLVIRALAVGELKLTDLWRVIRREVFAGLALGCILGLIGFLRISIWSTFSNLYGPHWLLVAFTVSTSLVGIVLWGTLVGSILPFILRRLGFDPATSSSAVRRDAGRRHGPHHLLTVGLIILRGITALVLAALADHPGHDDQQQKGHPTDEQPQLCGHVAAPADLSEAPARSSIHPARPESAATLSVRGHET
jgi:magnesium transporter